MKIALDFDNTITNDILFWADFIKLSKKYGHLVSIVTSRNENDDNSDIEGFALENNVKVVYCNHKQKQECYNAEIWIDDMPLSIPTMDSMMALSILS